MRITHMSPEMAALHGALIDIVSVMNRPRQDQALIDAAGIELERALFALLVIIDRRGPIGVVDLADRVGRDYTTVSRQVAKLEQLGLVRRTASAADRRVREAVVSPAGRAMNDAIDDARQRILGKVFETWTPKDVRAFVRLIQKFAADVA